jgi:hypothetical protein
MVTKIWRKEVVGPFCNFWEVARGIFGNILKTRGLHRIFVDYGFITKKRGASLQISQNN